MKCDELEMSTPSSLFPSPVSSVWKTIHCINYLIGGTTFLFGSVCYLPAYSDYVSGGWLFTIGSACFLFADLFEWWKNNRIGCAFDSELLSSYEDHLEQGGIFPKRGTPEHDSVYWRFKRAEPGINFFTSVAGSQLYLIGSVMFIPDMDTIVIGTWVFIFGSFIIATAQTWKLYRTGWQGLLDDKAAFGIDFGAGIGGIFYLLGSIYFLPQYDTSDVRTTEAASLFICGGLSFFLSGVCMFFKYFILQELKEALHNNAF